MGSVVVLGGKSGDLGQPEKAKDKGRWSQNAHFPITTGTLMAQVR
jgi:hypothetical protein